MKKRSRTAILVTAGSLVLFAIAAALPIWTASRLLKDGPISGIAFEGGPIWQADFVQESWVRERNWIQAGLLASVVTGGGLIVYRRLAPKARPVQSADYEEKADGSIPDGRTEPG